MTGLSTRTIRGDRFLVVSTLKKELDKEVSERYIEDAVRLFRTASKAQLLKSRGIDVYSSYSAYMTSYDDIEGFISAFQRDFRENCAKKSFFLKEQDNSVEIYDKFCHGTVEITLVAMLPRDDNLVKVLEDEVATIADLFF